MILFTIYVTARCAMLQPKKKGTNFQQGLPEEITNDRPDDSFQQPLPVRL